MAARRDFLPTMTLQQELAPIAPAKLAVEEVSKTFRTGKRVVHALDRVSLQVNEGEFVAMRESRDATLAAPTLILPSLQVNIRAGALPPASPAGNVFLKIPVTVVQA